jgi:hypothetical protein
MSDLFNALTNPRELPDRAVIQRFIETSKEGDYVQVLAGFCGSLPSHIADYCLDELARRLLALEAGH